MLRVLLFVLTLGLLAACNNVLPEKEPISTPKAAWSVKLTQSGGIAGVQRVVTVTSDGEVVASDERAYHSGTLWLTADQLNRLEELAYAAAMTKPTRTDSNCADCFIYDLEVRTEDGMFSAQLDDVTLPGSDLEPLVTYLRDLMEQALSTQ